jgi:hypothetical protein
MKDTYGSTQLTLKYIYFFIFIIIISSSSSRKVDGTFTLVAVLKWWVGLQISVGCESSD